MSSAGHVSSWYAASAHQAPELPPLCGSARADVCVVGGGYTGLSTALHLAERGADVVLLDLEDSVPLPEKAAARAGLAAAVAGLVAHGARVVVRVNAPLGLCIRDIEAACLPGVEAVMVPKATSAGQITALAAHLRDSLHSAALPADQIAIIALVESAAGLQAAAAIARAPQVAALAFGPEDFSADCGLVPGPDTLAVPAQALVLAARAAGIGVLGLPDSLAEVVDIDRFATAAGLARRMGFDGVLCIHPAQVAAVNAAFALSEADLLQAQQIVQAAEAAAATGAGAILLNGRMIDPPVVARALRLLRQNQGQTAPA